MPYKPISELEEDEFPALSPSEFWNTKKPEKPKAEQISKSVQSSFKDKFSVLKKFLNLDDEE